MKILNRNHLLAYIVIGFIGSNAATYLITNNNAHKAARALEERQKKQVYSVFGEGDKGLILGEYFIDSEFTDQQGYDVNPNYYYNYILPALLPNTIKS